MEWTSFSFIKSLLKRHKEPSNVFCCSSYSIQGKKKSQEDDMLVWQDSRDVVVLVADGVGSHGHGDWASHFVIHEVFEKTLNAMGVGEDPGKFLKETCYEAAKGVWRQGESNPDYKNCGTTLTGFVYRKDGQFWTINIGDSRVYLIRANGYAPTQLTEDQVEESRSRKMKYAIGQKPEYMHDHIEVYKMDDEIQLRKGDVLMAVSDGVCEPFEVPRLDNPLIYKDNDVFNKYLQGLQYSEHSAEQIVNFASVNGSKDNITCALMIRG